MVLADQLMNSIFFGNRFGIALLATAPLSALVSTIIGTLLAYGYGGISKLTVQHLLHRYREKNAGAPLLCYDIAQLRAANEAAEEKRKKEINEDTALNNFSMRPHVVRNVVVVQSHS